MRAAIQESFYQNERTAPIASAGCPQGSAKGHIPGEGGIWVLLVGDMLMFTLLFTMYLYARGCHTREFAESQETLNRTFGAVNTLVLLSSSLLVVYAGRCLRSGGDTRRAGRLMLMAVGGGALFIAIKLVEYFQKISSGITANTNEFYMYYFVLTGLHLSHVLVGLGILIALARNIQRSRGLPTPIQAIFFEGGSCFWHMVDLLWIIIYPLVFLVR